MRIPLLTGLVLITACGARSESFAVDADTVGGAPELDGDAAIVDPDVRIDVIPADQRDADGNIRALPQVFGPFPESELADAALALALERPIDVRGVVTGAAVAPYAGLGSLPTVEAPAPGRVRLVHTNGFNAYDVPTDPATGAYALDVVPGTYEIVTTPDSARMAPRWANYRIDDDADGPDVVLDAGQALYGRVRIGGKPYSDCEVLAVDAFGHATASTWTDLAGFYEIRVPAGAWTVMTGGGLTSRDPILTSSPAEVTADLGAEVDVEYPTTSTVTASVRVEQEDGSPAASVLVRFIAITLDNFGSLDADLVIENATSNDGNLDLVIPPGTWAVEIIPDDESALGPVAVAGPIEVREDRQLDTVILPGLVPLGGATVDGSGVGVADARITCSEVGFSGRSWSTFAGPDGRWDLSVSSATLECLATPPGERDELALGRVVVEASPIGQPTPDVAIELPNGVRVRGIVTFDGAAEPYSVVEVRTVGGVLLGAGLTDADGSFAVSIPPPQTIAR